ncbi:hypothetical protein CTAYLR_004662 [Chrysophaeum taylorii]|uniref:Methylenetetrahydrofolate dehydrogenase n=1 Tax=Chrysophaeum taylorii TaxID=2483200 RepID=A0AAD7U7A2_9STRA|nr:hypothetical protein CTAYLR_004662 [Chrysophaeum taylorii]
MVVVTRVDTTEVAEAMRGAIRADGLRPKLVGFLANEDPAARKYAEWTGRAASKDGIDYEIRELDPVALEAALDDANADPNVHGILIYYPVFGAAPSFFGGSMDDQLRDRVAVEKDVEGLCHTYRSNLYRNIRFMDRARTKKAIVPCTPLAVIKCLEHVGVHAKDSSKMLGKVVSVINRSEVVGRPLAAMLANDGATVYSIDVDSIYLMVRGKMSPTNLTPDAAIRSSDVVVLGVPSKNYKLPASLLKPNAVVVNVSTFKNLDDESAVVDYTYVPLVGRVTVACLERSLLTLYKQYHARRTVFFNRNNCTIIAAAAASALLLCVVALEKKLAAAP